MICGVDNITVVQHKNTTEINKKGSVEEPTCYLIDNMNGALLLFNTLLCIEDLGWSVSCQLPVFTRAFPKGTESHHKSIPLLKEQKACIMLYAICYMFMCMHSAVLIYFTYSSLSPVGNKAPVSIFHRIQYLAACCASPYTMFLF